MKLGFLDKGKMKAKNVIKFALLVIIILLLIVLTALKLFGTAALKIGVEQMEQGGADLLLANDPDADRVGVALMLVLVYWAAFAIFNALGLEAILDPMVAAWTPNILFGLMGTYLMLYIRT